MLFQKDWKSSIANTFSAPLHKNAFHCEVKLLPRKKGTKKRQLEPLSGYSRAELIRSVVRLIFISLGETHSFLLVEGRKRMFLLPGPPVGKDSPSLRLFPPLSLVEYRHCERTCWMGVHR